MKSILFSIMGMAIFASIGWQAVDRPTTSAPDLRPDIQLAYDMSDIAGTWHSFPVGLMVRFNHDGTASFGLDADGKAIGYHGNTWFEGEQLFIEFTDYDGEYVVCATAKGVYQIQLLSNGGVTFVPVHDKCQLRAAVLSGPAQPGAELVFHPVR